MTEFTITTFKQELALLYPQYPKDIKLKIKPTKMLKYGRFPFSFSVEFYNNKKQVYPTDLYTNVRKFKYVRKEPRVFYSAVTYERFLKRFEHIAPTLSYYFEKEMITRLDFNISMPESEKIIPLLQDNSDNSAGKCRLIREKKKQGIYGCRVRLSPIIEYGIGIEQRAEKYINAITAVMDSWNGEIQSEGHLIPTMSINAFNKVKDNLVKYKNSKEKDRRLLNYPYTFTLYLDDKESLAHLAFIVDDLIQINQIDLLVE